jgi:F0F1-type ATP synthase assembly protein I
MKNVSAFLRKGILADQSAQDTIEYVIMATIVLGLGIIVYAILRSVMSTKSNDINSKWPAIG